MDDKIKEYIEEQKQKRANQEQVEAKESAKVIFDGCKKKEKGKGT